MTSEPTEVAPIGDLLVRGMAELQKNMGYVTRHNLLMALGLPKNGGGMVVSPLIKVGLVKTLDGGNGIELTHAGEQWLIENRDAMATLVVSQAVKTAPNSVFALAGMLPSKNLPKRQKEK